VNPEITTRTQQTTTGETEPALTLSQVQALLRDAAAFERAQRPIVLHATPQPAATAQASPAGADLYVPMPPASAFTPAAAQPDKRSPWGLLFMVSGCAGLGACATTAVTGSQYSLLAFFACVVLWGTSAYQLVILRKG
jgi:hypothetical protein